MLITFFLILIAGAFGSLFFGIKWKRWIMTLVATVLFMVLAFSSFKIEVPSGGINLVFEEIVIILLCWAAAIISLIFTLFGAVTFLKDESSKKKDKQERIMGGAG